MRHSALLAASALALTLALGACSPASPGPAEPPAPEPAPAPQAPPAATLPSATPTPANVIGLEGLGDLKLGQPVPAGSSWAERGAQEGGDCRTVSSPAYPGVYAIVTTARFSASPSASALM